MTYLRDAVAHVPLGSHAICWLGICGLLVFLCIFMSCVLTRYRPGLQQIPGPFFASFSGLWRSSVAWRGNFEKVIRQLHQEYGPFVRIGPNTVSVGDAEYLSAIYGLKQSLDKTDLLKSNMMVYKGQQLPNLFAIPKGTDHAILKRPVAHAYSLSAMLDLEADIDECTSLFLRRLDEESRHGSEPVDLSNWLQYYAFDVIGQVTFSKKFGFLQRGADVAGMLENIHNMMVYQSLVGHISGLHEWLLGNPLLKYIMPRQKQSDYITDFTLERISERETSDVKRPDLMGKLFAVRTIEESRMPVEHILSHTTTNVFAGSDTTAIALRAMVYYLSKNPSVYDKVVAEINQAEATGQLSRFATYAEAQRLPYFQAFVKETMRHFAPTGILLERRVPQDGLLLGDIRLPEGAIVGMSAWVIHFDKSVFGEDAESFRVERWLDTSLERRKKMDKFWFTFGSGSRTCIGKNIALMEMNKLVLQLLRHYDISLADPRSEWKLHTLTVVKQSNIICNVRPRAGEKWAGF